MIKHNEAKHLENVVSRAPRPVHERTQYHAQKRHGGIGKAAYDPKQKDIRTFFDGAAAPKPGTVLPNGGIVVLPNGGIAEANGDASSTLELAEGRSESNAEDEADVEIEETSD